MNFLRYGVLSAVTASLALTACTNGAHQISTSAGSAQAGLAAQRRIDAAAARHGRLIEQKTLITVTDGHNHAVFPADAVITRNGDGLTVTTAGRVSTFSKDATVDRSGIYRSYAAQ